MAKEGPTRLMRQAVPLLAAALLFVKVTLVVVAVVRTSLSVELLDSASAGGGSARSALDRDNQWWSRQHSADSLQGSGAGTDMVYMPTSQDGHRRAAYGEETTGDRRSTAVADHTGKEAAAPSRATPRRTQGLFRAPPKPVAQAEEETMQDPKAFWWAKPLQPVLDEAEGRTPQQPQVQQAHQARDGDAVQQRDSGAKPEPAGKGAFWYAHQAGASPTDMGTDAVFTPKEHSSIWAANEAANGAAQGSQNGGSSGRRGGGGSQGEGASGARQPTLEDIQRTVGTNPKHYTLNPKP